MNKITFFSVLLLTLFAGCTPAPKGLTAYVNPFIGTTTLWDSVDLGYKLFTT